MLNLPTEIIHCICFNLNRSDLKGLALTCHRINTILDEHFWRHKYQLHYQIYTEPLSGYKHSYLNAHDVYIHHKILQQKYLLRLPGTNTKHIVGNDNIIYATDVLDRLWLCNCRENINRYQLITTKTKVKKISCSGLRCAYIDEMGSVWQNDIGRPTVFSKINIKARIQDLLLSDDFVMLLDDRGMIHIEYSDLQQIIVHIRNGNRFKRIFAINLFLDGDDNLWTFDSRDRYFKTPIFIAADVAVAASDYLHTVYTKRNLETYYIDNNPESANYGKHQLISSSIRSQRIIIIYDSTCIIDDDYQAYFFGNKNRVCCDCLPHEKASAFVYGPELLRDFYANYVCALYTVYD